LEDFSVILFLTGLIEFVVYFGFRKDIVLLGFFLLNTDVFLGEMEA
jgi:hypothetical protein